MGEREGKKRKYFPILASPRKARSFFQSSADFENAQRGNGSRPRQLRLQSCIILPRRGSGVGNPKFGGSALGCIEADFGIEYPLLSMFRDIRVCSPPNRSKFKCIVVPNLFVSCRKVLEMRAMASWRGCRRAPPAAARAAAPPERP